MTNDEAKKMLDYAKGIGCRSFKFGELEAEFYAPIAKPQNVQMSLSDLRPSDDEPVSDDDLFGDISPETKKFLEDKMTDMPRDEK